MNIARFVLRRIVAMAALLLLLSMLVFSLTLLSPGSEINSLLGSRPPSPAVIAALKVKYGLNDSAPVQYWHWLVNAVHFNFGTSGSVELGESVSQLILTHLAVSLELAFYTLVLVFVIGVPVGMLAALKRGRLVDRAVSFGTTLAVGAPAFVLAFIMLEVFGVELGWFPVYGLGTGALGRLSHLTLPAVSVAITLSAIVIRQARASTLSITGQDYVSFAQARGLSPTRIFIQYIFRNAALPIVTSAGLFLVVGVVGLAFVEEVFALPGIGSLFLAAVDAKDVQVIQGVAMFLSAFIVCVNLVVDLLSFALDPRTRYKTGGL